MNKTNKFCINCKHVEIGPYGENFYKCNAPQNLSSAISNLTGDVLKEKRIWKYCTTHRIGVPIIIDILFGLCGNRGRWFEPKDK